MMRLHDTQKRGVAVPVASEVLAAEIALGVMGFTCIHFDRRFSWWDRVSWSARVDRHHPPSITLAQDGATAEFGIREIERIERVIRGKEDLGIMWKLMKSVNKKAQTGSP